MKGQGNDVSACVTVIWIWLLLTYPISQVNQIDIYVLLEDPYLS